MLASLKDLKADHPLWGYRRCWAYLFYRQHIIVNKKRIYWLMKEQGLLVTKINRYKAKRKISRPKPKASYPNHIWGTDITKIKIGTWGWYTKEIIGYSLSLQSKNKDWQEALYQAVQKRFPAGIKDSLGSTLYLVSDNGCQPTSLSYMQACSTLGIKQIFTSWSNPKGNADTERVIRTLKEDLVWPYDWDNPFTFQRALDKWVDNYNQDFPH
ncbi:MAG: IS3 family transposase [Atribacterota bacterium]|nr:IS3 family transposase [Atribacterota bacterium]